jgi:hypothetical protein
MTTREPVNTNLIVGIILPLYRMDQGDVEALASDLRRQVMAEYGREIQRNLNLYGCQRLYSGPDQTSQAWIDDYVGRMSESIARTYNSQLQNEIRRQYTANPRANRFSYIRALDAWTVRRNAYKVPSIALNSMTQVRAYAQDRFIRENKITGRFAMVGPPPVCKICIRIKANGPLPWEECQRPENRLPAHVNCPHRREALVLIKIDCANAWTG